MPAVYERDANIANIGQETIGTMTIGELQITFIRKDVKNVHLTVHPPDGRITLVAPSTTRFDVARAYAISKLRWIRQQQQQLLAQARESPRECIERETHFLWGRRYLLKVRQANARPRIDLDHGNLTLTVRPNTEQAKRAEIIHNWHKSLLHDSIPPLIAKWEEILGVQVHKYFLQRMKTRWGSCHHAACHIRLNTELVKKPKHLLEYVIVHEMIHLIEPTHNSTFVALLSEHYPAWREARAELNELPVSG